MVPRMLNFLLLPVHTRNAFTPEQYGVFTQLSAIIAFLNIIYMFGMETAYFRFASKPGADTEKVYNLAQTAVLAISITLSLIFIFLSWPVSRGLEVSPQIIVWIAFIMLIDAAVAIPFARLRFERKALKFSVARIINVLILIALNLYFLKINKSGYDPAIGIGYVFIANLIANSFYVLFVGRLILSWRPAFDREVFPAMVRYAFPIMLLGIPGMINEMFSRFMLEWWLPENFYPGRSNEHAVGVFGACYKFAVFMNLAIQAFRFAAEPFFFRNASDKNSPVLFARINHYFIIVCCIFLLGISINLDLLKQFFIGKEYWEGLDIVPVLLLAYLFLGVYYNFSVWFKLTDKTYYGTMITAGGAALTVLLNYALIPVAGYLGSSWATLLCYLAMSIACYLLGQKYYPVPYEVGKGLLYITGTITIVYIVNNVKIPDLWLATVIHTGILIVCLGMVFLIERKGLRRGLA